MRKPTLLLSLLLTSFLGAACVADGDVDDPAASESELESELEAQPLCPNIKETLTYPKSCVTTSGQLGTKTCSQTLTIYRRLDVSSLDGPKCITTGSSSTPEVCGPCVPSALPL